MDLRVCPVLNLFSLSMWWTCVLVINKFRAVSPSPLQRSHDTPSNIPLGCARLYVYLCLSVQLSSSISLYNDGSWYALWYPTALQKGCTNWHSQTHSPNWDREFFLILKIFLIWEMKRVSHFHLYSLTSCEVKRFYRFIGHLYFFFSEASIHVFCPFSI